MEGYKSCVHLFEKIKAGSPFKKRTAHYGAIYRWAATVDGSGAQLDRMEGRNVNRILNSTMRDVRDKRFKVDVLGDAVERTELGTEVIRLPKNLWNPDVIRAVAQCDVVFGCMDTVDGRYLLNALSSYY